MAPTGQVALVTGAEGKLQAAMTDAEVFAQAVVEEVRPLSHLSLPAS